MPRQIEEPQNAELIRGLLDVPEHGWRAVESICRREAEYAEASALAMDLPDHQRQYRSGVMAGMRALAGCLFVELERARKSGRKEV